MIRKLIRRENQILAIKIFNAIVYLPIIVIGMIVGQIYFESYLDSFSRYSSILAIIISITYFIQELCLLQISFLNLTDLTFTMVLPITMLFRKKHSAIWWELLAATPLLSSLYKAIIGINSFGNWWIWVLKAGFFVAICWILIKYVKLPIFTRYTMAIISLGIVDLLTQAIEGRLQVISVSAATLGLAIFLILEKNRYAFENKNKQKIKLLREESVRDDLTGLHNYRALSQELSGLAQRQDIHNICIGALDIDHFKSVNDRYGHFAGNEVLNTFSATLRKRIHAAFPGHAHVYRFGGEEFSIIVTNYPITEIHTVLQDVEDFFNQQPIVTSEGMKIRISFSASLTNHLNGEILDDTLKRADRMLYSVKDNGRGWIITDHYHKQSNSKDKE